MNIQNNSKPLNSISSEPSTSSEELKGAKILKGGKIEFNGARYHVSYLPSGTGTEKELSPEHLKTIVSFLNKLQSQLGKFEKLTISNHHVKPLSKKEIQLDHEQKKSLEKIFHSFSKSVETPQNKSTNESVKDHEILEEFNHTGELAKITKNRPFGDQSESATPHDHLESAIWRFHF